MYSAWNSAQWLHGNLDGRGVWGRMETDVCMAESPHCSPETVTTLFVNQLHPNQLYKIQGGKGKTLSHKRKSTIQNKKKAFFFRELVYQYTITYNSDSNHN